MIRGTVFSKENSLEVKGIAILLLLFHHLFRTEKLINSFGIVLQWVQPGRLTDIAAGARICVWLFAFVSAYGITIQYLRRADDGLGLFLWKRWVSLMSGFWFCYLLVILFYLARGGDLGSVYEGQPANALFEFFGISDLLGTPRLRGVWWYMCFAQVQLLILPFIIEAGKKIGWSLIPMVFIIQLFLVDGIHSTSGGSYLNYLMVTVVAVICAEKDFFARIRKDEKPLPAVIIAVLLLIGIAGLVILRVKGIDDISIQGLPGLVYAGAALLLVIFVYKYLDRSPFKTPLCVLGKYSGIMFMTHWVFLAFYSKYVGFTHNVFGSWITATLMSLATAFVIDRLIRLVRYDVLMKKLSGLSFKSTD